MGNYMGAAIFCEKVLKLLQNDPNPDLEQKVRLRMGKAYMLARRPAQAAKAVATNVDDSDDKRQIEGSIRAVEASDTLFSNTTNLREKLMNNLSRFKFAM